MTPEERVERILRGCPENVKRHLHAVADYAAELAEKTGADPELTRLGALLHDVGRCRTHSIQHVAVSARLVEDAGFDPAVVRVVRRHVGAGLTPDEARKLGLPEGDYMPKTLEEKIVAYADNRFGGDKKLGYEESLKRFRRKVADPDAVKRYQELHHEIHNA